VPSGPTEPCNGERTERRPFPGNPPEPRSRTGSPPAEIDARLVATDRRRRQTVRGGRRGSRGSTHAPDGTDVPVRNTVPIRKKSGKPEQPELPQEYGRKREETGKNGRKRTERLAVATSEPPPPDPAGPARQGSSLRPCLPFPEESRGPEETRIATDAAKYQDPGRRCQATIHCPPSGASFGPDLRIARPAGGHPRKQGGLGGPLRSYRCSPENRHHFSDRNDRYPNVVKAPHRRLQSAPVGSNPRGLQPSTRWTEGSEGPVHGMCETTIGTELRSVSLR